jgi:hypothetical protein
LARAREQVEERRWAPVICRVYGGRSRKKEAPEPDWFWLGLGASQIAVSGLPNRVAKHPSFVGSSYRSLEIIEVSTA